LNVQNFLPNESTALTGPVVTAGPAAVDRRRGMAGLLALAIGWAAPAARAAPGEVRTGELLRDATMQGLNGPNKRLADYRGRALLINVWASWCGPCRQEMASLERLAWKDQKVPFAVIGISTDDYPERALALLNGTHASISHFIDRKLELENLLGASRLPLTVLVNADGRVVDKVYGAKEWDGEEAARLIARAFGKR
jgi:thiol-disulfide isomerase/thioredoxin